MRFPFIAIGLGLCALVTEAAVPFRVCTLDVPFYPHTLPNGKGQLQHLLRRAARTMPLQFENHVAPRRRCLDELKNGQTEAIIGAWIGEREAYAAFPMRNGALDEAQALTVTRFMLFRRKGSTSSWDGGQFSGLGNGLIGVQLGFVHVAKLQATGAPYDDGARSAVQNLEKLRLGRLAGVIAMEEEAGQLVQNRYRDVIEAVEPPFDRTVLYLMVARPFYEQNRELVERYWQAIRSERESAGFRQYLQQYR
ncbi:substrate-binding periplasmic protein [Chitinimonas naiadis]